MFIISGGRGTGKTRTLLEKAKAENAIVACVDPDTMRERAYSYGIVGLDFVSYSELYDNNYELDRPIYIHDVNAFIRSRFSDIKGYSLSFN